MGTKREQVIVLPPFSVHARAAGNCVIRFRVDGKQHSIATATRNRREAAQEARPLLIRWMIAHGQATVQKTPMRAEIEAFLAVQYRDLKPATREEAALVLDRFEAAFPYPSIQDMTPAVFREGVDRLRGDASPKYWANILSICRRFARALVDQGKILQDFTRGVPMPKRSTFGRREVTWEDAELEAVLAVLEPFDQEVLRVMRMTGMDSSDVYELRRRHLIRDDAGALTIRKRREKSKTEEETILQPIASAILPILERRLKETKRPEDRLFGEGFLDARSFTKSLLGRVRRATAAAGLPLKHLKALRHTFATYHAERGVPLDVLRAWMGHARDSRVLDRIYVHRASTSRFMN